MMPAKFSPYDYWNETPTRCSVAMEGLTSYYGDLTLLRAGLWTVERYLRHLPRRSRLSRVCRRGFIFAGAGQLRRLAQRSRADARSRQCLVSFYNKGEIVSALLDLTIRRATNGQRSLDDVIRLLWQEHGSGKGMEEDAVERAVARVADVGDFFARYVEGTEPLPYEELFTAAGITFAAAPREPESASLGAKVKMQDGLLLVEGVIRGGAGMDAGLLPWDELLAARRDAKSPLNRY